MTPCAGLCPNPTMFSSPPSYQANNLGQGPGCFQTLSPLTSFTCGNSQGRQFSINGMNVNCTTPPRPADIPLRNGGYCIRVSPGGNQAAFFSAN